MPPPPNPPPVNPSQTDQNSNPPLDSSASAQLNSTINEAVLEIHTSLNELQRVFTEAREQRRADQDRNFTNRERVRRLLRAYTSTANTRLPMSDNPPDRSQLDRSDDDLVDSFLANSRDSRDRLRRLQGRLHNASPSFYRDMMDRDLSQGPNPPPNRPTAAMVARRRSAARRSVSSLRPANGSNSSTPSLPSLDQMDAQYRRERDDVWHRDIIRISQGDQGRNRLSPLDLYQYDMNLLRNNHSTPLQSHYQRYRRWPWEVPSRHRTPLGRMPDELPDSQVASSEDDHYSDRQGSLRRSKRLKVSHDNEFEGYDPVHYGWNGQIDPGQLRLDVVSCDGGNFNEQSIYRAENVLKNDDTVYCSKSCKCTLVFRHHAAAPFELETIVIKGPEHGYPSPVQQGLVFVGMSQAKLEAAASAYQMSHLPAEESTNPSSLPRYIREIDTNITNNRQDRRAIVYSRYGSPPAPHDSHTLPASLDDEAILSEAVDYDCDFPVLEPSRSLLTSAPSPPSRSDLMEAFRGVTEDLDSLGSDVEIEEALGRRPRQAIAYRYDNHIVIASGQAPPRRPNVLEDEGMSYRRANLENPQSRAHHCPHVSRIERVPSPSGSQDEVIKPCARFFINRGKSKVTIKFDPPISGRYIVLKLFSPNKQSENIGVQYVAAYGFSGRRFIPAMELR